MAGEHEEQKHEEQEERKEQPQERRERPQERRREEPAYSESSHPGRRAGDRAQEFCPRCRTAVEPGHMGTHMFHAHEVERRQQTTSKRTPAKRRPAPKDNGDEKDEKEKEDTRSSRWADVRKSW